MPIFFRSTLVFWRNLFRTKRRAFISSFLIIFCLLILVGGVYVGDQVSKMNRVFRGSGDAAALYDGDSEVRGDRVDRDTADLKTDTAVLAAKQDDLAEEVKELKADNVALRHDMLGMIIAITAVPVITLALPALAGNLRRHIVMTQKQAKKHQS